MTTFSMSLSKLVFRSFSSFLAAAASLSARSTRTFERWRSMSRLCTSASASLILSFVAASFVLICAHSCCKPLYACLSMVSSASTSSVGDRTPSDKFDGCKSSTLVISRVVKA
ncbi:uncharacterized protein M421DRAFT_303712 [Didymella exigua CBS 183.55]|uniref:Uncharacterized protein n=1 Tax=Didymella exigua CBS 183.55 TaxID=1150837 RepID=A0A6A5R6V2_9PLEO|nr:uncharacterized protein M421DRAFT_303712 [Didymella exigua CBS 183.55]KAF1923875.1 hypothetical protein M421DRAFT_303712 [Didymella exigua CBS 183.55]